MSESMTFTQYENGPLLRILVVSGDSDDHFHFRTSGSCHRKHIYTLLNLRDELRRGPYWDIVVIKGAVRFGNSYESTKVPPATTAGIIRGIADSNEGLSLKLLMLTASDYAFCQPFMDILTPVNVPWVYCTDGLPIMWWHEYEEFLLEAKKNEEETRDAVVSAT